jgi:hypothetical protein
VDRGRWVALCFVGALAFAGAHVSAVPLEAQGSAHRLIDVPYLPQSANLCGGAALAMVMRYWGDRAILPADFQGLVTSPSGIVTTDLAKDITRRGWVATAGSAPALDPLGGLQHDVDLGRPVITLLEVSAGHFHYVVVVGVTADKVVFHDPARTAFRVEDAEAFDRAWRGSARWRLLVLPPTSRARPDAGPVRATATNPAHARAGACGALVDQAVALADSDAGAAETTLAAALDLCPRDASPWLELAGLRFRQSRWHDAADLAETAVALAPSDTDAWALLATARFMSDDEAGALDAWNHLGEPTVDLVTIAGAHRSPEPALQRLIGLEGRTVLTSASFDRATRQFGEAPSALATRLTFVPHDDGRATVEASLVERDAFPRHPLELVSIGARAIFSDDIRVVLAGLAGQGESLTAAWRWPSGRARVGAMLSLPAPTPLNGVVTIDGFWEEQTYLLPQPDGTSSPLRDTRRRVTANLGSWVSGATRIDLGAGIDRLTTSDYLTLHAGLEHHLFTDRLIVRADAELWRLGPTGGFSTADGTLTWSTDPDDTHPSVSGVAGLYSASALAPRDLWIGAGTGQGRPVLLRAHPLIDHEALDSPFFGRQLAFATTEYNRPIRTTLAGVFSAAAFVDMAQAWHGLAGPGPSPFEADAGVGFRLRVLRGGGVARLDVAKGLIDGDWTLSAGWSYGSRIAFSRGTPW